MGIKKINQDAFTITETLISMLISALVIGISYFFIATIYDQVKWYSNTSQNTEEFARVSYELNRKIFEANTIRQQDKYIEILSIADTTRIEKSNEFKPSNYSVSYKSLDTISQENKKYLKINFMISHSYGETPFLCYYEIFK